MQTANLRHASFLAAAAIVALALPAHAQTRALTAAFDQAKIAAALSTAARSTYTAYRLPFNQFEFSTDRKSISFNAGGSRWTCDVAGARCESKERRTEPPSVASP